MEGERKMLICTNCKSKKGLKLIKKMKKRKLKMKWNSIGIRYENHEKKKVTDCGQRHTDKRVG